LNLIEPFIRAIALNAGEPSALRLNTICFFQLRSIENHNRDKQKAQKTQKFENNFFVSFALLCD